MFLCLTGRRSAVVLDPAFRSLLRLDSLRLKNGALTLHKETPGHRHRSFCRTIPGQLQPVYNRDSKRWYGTLDLGHKDRDSVAAVVGTIVSCADRNRLLRQAPGSAVFIRSWVVSTATMQTRASSTRSNESSKEYTADSIKADEQKLNDASTNDSSTTKASKEPEPEGGKPTKTQRLKKLFKEYGAVGASFHICISLMSLGTIYLLVSSGIDMGAMLGKLGFNETVVQSKMAAGTSTFVLAYAVHKLFAPARMSITLVSVPLIVRYLRKTGLFKPPTPAP